MGRKEERYQKNLEVKLPSFFRCPISLDVMKSPVSLCTGVTYDRSSIQRWLETGNNTCPATMQPLPSTDLVPNLTLQRLIHLWSSAASPRTANAAFVGGGGARGLLQEIRSSADPTPSLRKLAAFFSDDDADEFEKNNLINAGGFAPTLASLLQKGAQLATLEVAIRVLSLILTADSIEREKKQIVTSSLASNLDGSVSSLIYVLKDGSSLESRIDAARVLDAILTSILPSDAESKVLIAEKQYLIPELIRLIGEEEMDRAAIEAGLACLVGISGVRRARIQMVRLQILPALTRVLAAPATVSPPAAAERALRLMEAAAGCADGRAAICETAEESLGAVLGRMMKVGKEGTEAAAVVIWSVCCLFRDRRAEEAMAAANGGVAKILLLMQSNCSPAVRQMAGDLIKIFGVNSKSCISGYDTKTTHIRPF